MATLTSTKIKNTYDALLKSIDNDAIGTTAKQITDGLGNVTPLYVSTTQVGIGVTPESGLNLHVYGDAKIGSNLTVIGNLVVEGSTTTVGTDTLTVKDPLIVLANNNTSTDAVDIGFYGKYTPSGTTLYSGLFREALTGKYRLFKDLQVEPTTTVNTSGTGYAQATLIAALEGDVTGNITGNVTGNLTGNVTGNVTGDVTGDLTGDVTGDVTGDLTGNVTATSVLADGVTATTQSSGDNSTKVATTAYVDSLQISSTLSEILANGNTSGGTDIAVSAGDDITFTDTSKSIYGTDGELEIHHNGSNSYITEDGTGALYLQGTYMYLTKSDGSQNYIELDLDGATDSRVKLNYGGATVLTTTSTGITVSGIISGLTDPSAAQDAATKAYVDSQVGANNELSEVLANGNTSGANDIIMADDQKVNFGDDSDLQIYHDGSDSYIKDSGTGNLKVLTNSIEIKNAAGTKNLIVGEETTGVELYAYNNSTNSLEKVFYTQDAGSGFPSAFFEEQLYIKSGTGSGSTFGSINYYTEGSGNERGGIKLRGGNGSAGDRMFIGDAWIQSLPDAGAILGVVEFFPASNPTTAIAKYQFTSGDAYFGNSSSDVDVNIKGALDVTQNATFAGNINIESTLPRINLTDTDNNDDWSIFNNNGTYTVFNSTDAVSAFYINSSNNATFAGNVGIGTSSPTVQLDIEDSSNVIVDINTTTANSNTTIRFQESGSNTATIGYDSTNDGLILTTGGFTAGNGIFIDDSQNVGIGTASPQRFLHINSSNIQVAALIESTNTTSAQLNFKNGSTTNNGGFIKTTGDNIILTANSTSANHLVVASGGNVGIGTTSPSSMLHLQSASSPTLRIVDTTNNATLLAYAQNSDAHIGTYSNHDLIFDTNSSERMRIDSNGNFGFRVTAENSSGTWRNFQIGGGANLVTRGSNANDLLLGTGFYFNTANQELYKNTESVSRMFFNNDVITFQNAASGTAGTAITWNERMRITSGGGVSIGSTNPSLDTSLRVFKAGVSVQARIGESNSSYSTLGQNSLIRFQGRNTADTASVYGDIGLDVDNQLLIFNDPGTTGGSVGTNPMTLDASGNLTVGGSIKASSSAYVQLEADQTDSAAVRMGVSSASLEGFVMCNNQGAGHISGNTILKMLTYSSGGALIESSRFTTNGLGVKTTLNAHTLQVGGDIGINSTGNCRFRFYRGDFKAGIQVPDTAGQMIDSSAVDDLAIRSQNNILFATGGNTERMRIYSSGNIQTTGKLDVGTYVELYDYAAGAVVANRAGYLKLESQAKTGWAPDDEHGKIIFYGRDTSGVGARNAASIRAINTQGNGSSTTTFDGALAFYTSAYNSFEEEAMRITSGGDLHVDGDVVAYSTTISDKRLKDNVKPLESSLDKVMNLKGVEYVWNNGSRKGQKDIGFIAQEVEEIIPEIVREKEVIFNKEEKYKTVDYEKITAVLVEAVKELTAKVERLENKCK